LDEEINKHILAQQIDSTILNNRLDIRAGAKNFKFEHSNYKAMRFFIFIVFLLILTVPLASPFASTTECGDTTTLSVGSEKIATTDLKIGAPRYGRPTDLVLSPDGTRLYVACQDSGHLVVIDTIDERIVDAIGLSAAGPFNACPYSVAITPDGKKVYVANQGTLNVAVVNTTTNHARATFLLFPPWSLLHRTIGWYCNNNFGFSDCFLCGFQDLVEARVLTLKTVLLVR